MRDNGSEFAFDEERKSSREGVPQLLTSFFEFLRVGETLGGLFGLLEEGYLSARAIAGARTLRSLLRAHLRQHVQAVVPLGYFIFGSFICGKKAKRGVSPWIKTSTNPNELLDNLGGIERVCALTEVTDRTTNGQT